MSPVRKLVVSLALVAGVLFLSVPLSGQSSSLGQWSSVFQMPLVPVHAALMHTGELLVFDAWEIPGTPSARLWNPTTDTYTQVPNGFAELFCAGHFLSSDGRLLTSGGHNGAGVGTRDATVFDPSTNLWTALPDLNYARWYPTLVQLADGRALTMGGAISRPAIAEVPEALNLGGGGWTALPAIQKNVGEYPQLFQTSNGSVFVSAMDETYRSWMLDPSLTSWTLVGSSGASTGAGVMYRPNKVMMTGGGTLGSDPVVRNTSVIDLGSPTPAWRSTAPMAFGRSLHNLVILPDGKVLVVGGATEVSLIATSGVLPAEIWDPDTETWTQVASMTRPRMYHSIAILLPDGRVLAAGGGRINPGVPDETNGQFYSPPYLFKGSRPVVTGAPAAVTYGSTFTVDTPAPGNIARVTLVRASSVTHAINMDQRFAELAFTVSGGGLEVVAPNDAYTAPAGDYLLFALDANDVPSLGRIVRLGGTAVASSLSVNDVSVNEGGPGTTTPMVFTVTLNGAAAQTVSVHYATADGTATAPSDYTAVSGTLTFPPGTTTRTVTVPIAGDAIPEANETLTLQLSAPSGAAIADGIGTGTIVNDDVAGPSVLAIDSVTVTEGSGAGQTVASFTVTLSPASAQNVLVSYRTLPGTAVSPADFASTAGTLTFAGGTTVQTIQVPIVRDTIIESTETFSVELYDAVQASIGTPVGTGTILDDDSGTITATYVLSSGGDDVNEDGATFTAGDTTVWTGTAGTAAESYAGLRFSGVTIPAGATVTGAYLDVTSATTQWSAMAFEIAAEAAADSAPFSASSRPSQRPLLAPRVSHVSDVQWTAGTHYPLDDISSLIQAVVQQPGWASGHALAIVLRGTGGAWARKYAASAESGAATAPRLVVTYGGGANQPPVITTAQGTPTTGTAPLLVSFSGAATDPEGAPLTYTWAFGDGQNATGANVSHTYSGVGTFGATLTVSDGAQQAVSAPIVIQTASSSLPALTVSDVTVIEGTGGSNAAVFTVTRSSGGSTVSVSYATADGTATAPADYIAKSGVLTLTGPTLTGTISVPIVTDAVSEPTETFTLQLSNAVGAAIADGTGVATILDDDGGGGGGGTPSLSIADVAVNEGNSGTTAASFIVSLSAPADVTVHYQTVDGTAIAPGDYAPASGTLTFSGGATTRVITVPVSGDNSMELSETFQVVLSNPSGAALADAVAVGTILNDDTSGSIYAPRGLHLQLQGQVATLGWVPGVMPAGSGFVVEVGTSAGGSEVGQFFVGTFTQVGGALPPGSYWVRVRAVAPTGQSAVSSEMQFSLPPAAQPPVTPGALSAWAVGNAVTLTWDTAPGNPLYYVLDVGSSPGLTDVTSFATGGLDTVLYTPAPPGTYYVRVRAVNAFGSSGPSNEVRVVVP